MQVLINGSGKYNCHYHEIFIISTHIAEINLWQIDGYIKDLKALKIFSLAIFSLYVLLIVNKL
jgi:hypothetical protein